MRCQKRRGEGALPLRPTPAPVSFPAVFDEVDEATAMYKIAATVEDVPVGGRFIYAGVDGDRVRSDWWLYILGIAAGVLNGTTPWPGAARPALPTAQSELAASLAFAGLLGRAPRPPEEIAAASSIAGNGPGEGAIEAVCQGLVDSAGAARGYRRFRTGSTATVLPPSVMQSLSVTHSARKP